MTLWKLEITRLVRTHRWLILVGVYAFFGVVGPLTARYLGEIMERFGDDQLQVIVGEPRPADGIVQFIGNASQLGLLAVIVVAAAALAFDARPERAAFLRTRVPHASDLVVPPYVVTTVTAALALVIGTALAWGFTVTLIGSLPVGALVIGTLYGLLYLTFAIAVVALVAGFMRSLVTTVFTSIAVLLLLPMVAMIDAVGRWMPTHLFAAVAEMVEGRPADEYLGAAGVTVFASALLLLLAVRRTGAREL